MKLVALPFVLVLALIASTAAGAATSSRATSASFCGVARGVARDIVASTSVSDNISVMRSNARTAYTKIAAAEPALLASAPGSLKPHLRPVFGFVNLLIVDLKKVNWHAGELGPYAPTLIARAKAVSGHIPPLKVYFRATCKLDV